MPLQEAALIRLAEAIYICVAHDVAVKALLSVSVSVCSPLGPYLGLTFVSHVKLNDPPSKVKLMVNAG